jgi:hypothetical protein
LIINVAALGDLLLHGPGVADPVLGPGGMMPGGGIAFYCPQPIATRHLLYEAECRRASPDRFTHRLVAF